VRNDEVTNLPADELRSKMKALARNLIRRRVFHRALTPIERGILHLSSREGLMLTSSFLRRTLLAIVEKASAWLEDSFINRVRRIGREKASLNVKAAQLMGHSGAGWCDDLDYISLLGLNALSAGAPP
jgi:hypothetical protein